MTDLLLLGILIMLIINFHYNANAHGRYAKLFNFVVHRPAKYTERKSIIITKSSYHKLRQGGHICHIKGKEVINQLRDTSKHLKKLRKGDDNGR